MTAIATEIDLSPLSLSAWEIALRLLGAMLIGIVIGTEREYTHRPAGMRTHMLVSIGACAVMITSQLIFCQYRVFGATPDPARLSAQVITGVGFLGAGTIIREGLSIKGLTTAASVWAVACLGIAVGAGYYSVAFIGTACMFVTLTLFEWLQRKMMASRYASHLFSITGTDAVALLALINTEGVKQDATIKGLEVNRQEGGQITVSFQAEFAGRHAETRLQSFMAALANDDQTVSVSSGQSRT